MHNIIIEITDELQKAKEKYPDWPADIIHCVAIMAEESGETVRAALNHVYHAESIWSVREEAIQTAAMALRLIESIDEDMKEEEQLGLF